MSTSARSPKQQIHFGIFTRRPASKGFRKQHYFHIVAGNGEIISSSEGYQNTVDRNHAMTLHFGLGPNTPVIPVD